MPQARSLRLAVFDCDGTLVDSQHSIIDSMNAAFDAHNHSRPEAEAVRGVVGLPLDMAIKRLLPEIDPDGLTQMEASYIEAFRDLRKKGMVADPLYPGALEILETLNSQGWVLGIATGKGSLGLAATLETHGLTNHFSTLQTADNGPGKPNPDMLLSAMSETGADPRNTAMIGDTTFDMEMALSAGTMAVGVSWGYHPTENLQSAGAHAVIDDFAELPEKLESLGGTPE